MSHLQPLVGFVMGLRTRVDRRVWVGRVRVWVKWKSPAPNPYPCPGFGGFGFDVTTRVFTLLATSKWEWSRGREGLGVEMGVNEGDGAPSIEMEGIPLLL